MKSVCLYFQIHQPFRYRRYRFFDIGNNHYYYDDYTNESIMRKVADHCYLPANELLLKAIQKHGDKVKVAFSISGIALDQFELYAPEVLESFKKLAGTNSVEFLSETFSHSLISVKSDEEFRNQVRQHKEKIKHYFNQEPTVFRNTELIYSDQIGATVANMGFKAMITEGAKHVLGWKSPNFLYCNAINNRLKVLLKNYKLSDDIAFRFSNQGWDGYPLTAKKYTNWLSNLDEKEEVVNLFMDYETFGEHQKKDTGIFDFLESFLDEVVENPKLEFNTPSEVADKYDPISVAHVPHPISWADEERDLTAWLGNEMQDEAFSKLYDQLEKIKSINDPVLLKDWNYLQSSDHFYYMCTKFFSDGEIHAYFNPYNSPYDAFINYMNILGDFIIRLNAKMPSETDQEILHLSKIIEEKEQMIHKYQKELEKLKEAKRKRTKSTARKKKTKTV